jgi:cell wall-associated NlpC family hydrolase
VLVKYLAILFLLALLASCSSSKKTTHYKYEQEEETPVVTGPSVVDSSNANTAIDPYRDIKEKYANYLGVPADSIINIKLYTFIEKWLNTPYKWGGTNEKGIDCSAFIQRLLNEVYDLKIPRTSIEQLFTDRVEPFRSSKYLSEGDILFFRTMEGKVVSHVGIYLHNYMFVNSSSSKGVSIASLKDAYWRQRFVAAGRVRVALAKN